MSNIVPFQFESFSIRTVTTAEGEILFVGKDVASALGYVNESDAMTRHCRGVVKRYPIVDALGRTQEARVIAEPDLYRMVAGSTLPEAEKFEAWVFEEVLPSIRKTGKYEVTPAFNPNSLSRLDIARMLLESETEKLAMAEKNAALEAQIEADAPKVTLAEEISADERSAITIREAAKILGFKEKDVREKARQLHYIFRNPRGQWEVYADTLRQGLMATKAEYINGLLFSVPCFTPRGLSEVRVGMGYGDLFKRIKRSMVTA